MEQKKKKMEGNHRKKNSTRGVRRKTLPSQTANKVDEEAIKEKYRKALLYGLDIVEQSLSKDNPDRSAIKMLREDTLSENRVYALQGKYDILKKLLSAEQAEIMSTYDLREKIEEDDESMA